MRADRVIAAIALALVVTSARPAAAGTPEAELKAEFIERFIRFVEWDEDDLPDNDFMICVYGESPMTPYLERIAKKRKLKGRHTTIETIAKLDEIDGCQVVLVAGTDKKRITSVISRAEGHPILTIADSAGAAAMGAIINFYRDDKHIKYEINARAGEDSGLVLRAKLLRLARIVRTKKGGS